MKSWDEEHSLPYVRRRLLDEVMRRDWDKPYINLWKFPKPTRGDIYYIHESVGGKPCIVSATDFGAVGDGITDDTVAIQAAMDICGGVTFAHGIYLTTDTIHMRGKAYLSGVGETLVYKGVT